jgi:hypothetical protein
MDAIISALVSFFLLAPLEAGVTRALVGAGVPEAMAGKVSACAKAAAPIIIRRATGDPAWLVGSVYALWTGSKLPDAILVEAAPGCAEPVAAARASVGIKA